MFASCSLLSSLKISTSFVRAAASRKENSLLFLLECSSPRSTHSHLVRSPKFVLKSYLLSEALIGCPIYNFLSSPIPLFLFNFFLYYFSFFNTLYALHTYIVRYPLLSLKCRLHDGREFCCFLSICIASTQESTWHVTGAQ